MAPDVQVTQDVRHRIGAIEDVEMNARHAVGPQVLGLAGGVFDADFAHGAIVFGEAFQARIKMGRNGRAAQGGEAPDLGGAQNRQDAGDDGNGNSGGGGAVLESVESGCCRRTAG